MMKQVNVDRRSVIAGGGASLLIPHTAALARPSVAPKQPFVWGVAASAGQTESRQGRGRSNWDVFADTPGKIADESTNARCTEFDLRYREDLDLLKAAGVPAFRFSIAWPRIQPDGPAINQAGIDLYARIIDAMLERGIDPWITLFHWDIPVWAGDFRQRDIAYRMADYAGIVVDKLGDRVRNWFAFNEPNVVAVLGYALGRHAPGITSPVAMAAAIHHENLAIGLMIEATRSRARAGSQVGTTHSIAPVRAASESAADQHAAFRLDNLSNRAFLDPLFGKGYPAPFDTALAPFIKDGDLTTIAAKPDFIAIVPYQLDTNDMKMWTDPAYTPAAWLDYARRAFDWSYAEGLAGNPKMMSLGLHLRIIGRPGRIWAFDEFLHHVKGHDWVWFATRHQIAQALAAVDPA